MSLVLIPQYRVARRSAAAPPAFSFLQATADTTDTTTYTFASQNLGAAASDRRIIVCVHTRWGAGTPTLTSVTVGGVTATISVNNSILTGGTQGNRAAIAIAEVPTGTAGNIVVTFSSTMVRCQIGVYRATGIATAASSTGSDVTATLSVTLTAPTDGFVIAAYSDSPPATATWSGGVSGDYSALVETFLRVQAASAYLSGSVTIGTGVSAGTGVLVVASWGA